MRPPCPIQLFIDPSPSNRTRVINDNHHASTYSNNTQARPSPLPSLPPFLHVSRLRYRRANLRVHQVERHGLSGRNRHGWPVPTGLQIFPSPSPPLSAITAFRLPKIDSTKGRGVCTLQVRTFVPVRTYIWPGIDLAQFPAFLPPPYFRNSGNVQRVEDGEDGEKGEMLPC